MTVKIGCDQDLKRMWEQGLPVKEIAARLGLASESPVSIRAKKMGLRSRRFKGMYSERNARIKAMHDQGKDMAEIAKAVGRSVKTVYDIINYGFSEPEKGRVKVSAAMLNQMIANAKAAKEARA